MLVKLVLVVVMWCVLCVLLVHRSVDEHNSETDAVDDTSTSAQNTTATEDFNQSPVSIDMPQTSTDTSANSSPDELSDESKTPTNEPQKIS